MADRFRGSGEVRQDDRGNFAPPPPRALFGGLLGHDMRWLFLLAVLVAGCSGGGTKPPPDPTLPHGNEEEASVAQLQAWIRDERQAEGVLYPGDTIAITVQDEPRYSIPSKVIPEDGEIRLAVLEGDDAIVKAAGRTLKQVEEEARRRYGSLLRSPYVTVSVLSYASRVVYVSGAVNAAGNFKIPNDGSLTLQRAIALAGDCAGNADRRHVRIFRERGLDGGPAASPPIDLDALIRHAVDVPLRPNDIIQVPAVAERYVSIFGKGVKNPGKYSWEEGITVTKLISAAGGLTKFADVADVRVLREGKTYRIDVNRIFDNEATDVLLEPGDVVRIEDTFL